MQDMPFNVFNSLAVAIPILLVLIGAVILYLRAHGQGSHRYVALRHARRTSDFCFRGANTFPTDRGYGDHGSDHLALPQEGYPRRREADTVNSQDRTYNLHGVVAG